jgi:hypothetical protein
MERLKQAREGLREREQRRRALVQMLRVKGVPRADAASGKVVQALARAGVFRLRGVLIGTHAFRLYPLILGATLPDRRPSWPQGDGRRSALGHNSLRFCVTQIARLHGIIMPR